MPPQDSGVRFDVENEDFGRPPQRDAGFDMTGKLVEWGIVETVEQAQYVLVGVGIFVLLLAGYFFMHSGGAVPPPPPIS